MWNNARLATTILPLTLLLAACGGGGGGGTPTTATADSGTGSSTTTSAPPASSNNDQGNQSAPPVVTDTPDETPATSQKTGPCAATYDDRFTLIEGLDASAQLAGLKKPARGEPYNDPAYNTCVVRVTNAKAEGYPSYVRNDYSRRQPFNADDSRVLVYAGGQTWHLYDVETLKHVRKLDITGAQREIQWHPAHPDVLYFMPNKGGMTISEYNVVTNEQRVVADFNDLGAIVDHPGSTSIKDVWPTATRVWTRQEGSPSSDARYWALIVENGSGKGLGMITYDLLANEIVGMFDFATDGGGVVAPDHISISPSGKYVVPSWSSNHCPSPDQLGTRNKPCGMMSYTADFSSGFGMAARSPHSDIGTDANGRDVIVASEYDSGWVEMWDLATGERTKLWQIYANGGGTAMHISARNTAKPGWVLISTYLGNGNVWHRNKIMAVEMTANPRILNIAHTYNSGGGYFSEPHAAVNRDFTKVMFNSNWNSSTDANVDAYMIELPENAVPAAR